MELDPLLNLVQRIRRETGRNIPTPNPNGPLSRARALFVLRDPGATETSGANETGILDPYVNCDCTSRRQRTALRKANINPAVCVWWNASPYHLGYRGTMSDTDCAMGSKYLGDFVRCCRNLRILAAMGLTLKRLRRWRGATLKTSSSFLRSSWLRTR
jgi:hypothetical protein